MRKRAKQASGVGATIAARRRALGWTLERLAKKARCARSYLWMIESGQRSAPRQEVLARIEKALAFNPGELVNAAQWAAVPTELRDQVESLRGTQQAARRLAQLVKATSLDQLHKSGELKRLVDEVTAQANQEQTNQEQTRQRPKNARPAPSVRAPIPSSLRASIPSSPCPSIPSSPCPSIPSSLRPFPPTDIPLINNVAAGYPREFTDLGYPAGIADQYVRVPGLTDPDAFACRVVGDSMLPEYREGDIVVFSPAREIKSGMDCLARLEPNSETTFKRVYVEGKKGKEHIRLQPLNPAYPARTLPREQVAGLFAAVSVTRVVGN